MRPFLKSIALGRVFSALLLTACLVLSSAGGAPPLCLATPFMAVAKRHAKLSLWIYNSLDAAKDRIKAGARWKDRDFPMGEAQADIQASLAHAEHAAGGTGIGEKTAEKQSQVFTSEAVCRTSKTSLEDAGAGVGHIAKNSGLPDKDVAQVLEHVTEQGLKTNAIFDKDHMNVSIAEVTDAFRVLGEGTPTAIPAKIYGTGALRSGGGDKGGGSIAEALIIAKDKRGGAEVSGWGIDETDAAYDSTAIDYLRGDHEMVQVGMRLQTIESKFGTPQKVDDMCEKLIKAKSKQPNRTHVFKYLDAGGNKPPQSLVDTINTVLANKGSSLRLSLDQFQPVTAIP